MNPDKDIPTEPKQASDEVAAPLANERMAFSLGRAASGVSATGDRPYQVDETRTAQRTVPTIETIESIEAAMLKLPQADCPVKNLFAPGIYWREIEIPAGAVALGHRHKTEHLNVLLSGRVRVLCDGQVKELVAPQVFSSPAGVRKLVYAVEPSRWANVHANPTDETDMAKLEVIFIEKSGVYQSHHHQEEMAKVLNQSERSAA